LSSESFIGSPFTFKFLSYLELNFGYESNFISFILQKAVSFHTWTLNWTFVPKGHSRNWENQIVAINSKKQQIPRSKTRFWTTSTLTWSPANHKKAQDKLREHPSSESASSTFPLRVASGKFCSRNPCVFSSSDYGSLEKVLTSPITSLSFHFNDMVLWSGRQVPLLCCRVLSAIFALYNLTHFLN
jgi:hypothetical protein